MRLYFVRHGESEANVLRIISNRGQQHGLTELGRAQAQQLAQRLAHEPITRVYCSPLLRAQETATIVAAQLGLPYKVADALREYDCGVLEGRDDTEAWRQHGLIASTWLDQHDYAYRPQGGESFDDIRRRFIPFVKTVAQRPVDGTAVLLVGHGGLYQLMLPLLFTNLDLTWVAERGIGHIDCVIGERTGDGFFCLEWCGRPIMSSTAFRRAE